MMTLNQMQKALRRGEGSDFEKHVLKLNDKTVVLVIAKFGEETIAEIAEANEALKKLEATAA
jgi:hypothetical protein